MIAAAASLIPDALPAVTVPSARTMGFNFARASMVVLRGCSSRSTSNVSAPLPRMGTGTISSAKKPDSCAAAARCWLRKAIASCSSRLTLYSCATFSAVSAIESTPCSAFMRGLTSRQPIVVSCTAALRANGVSALSITKGARDMLSTPPAMARSISPARIARAAVPTASMPEPHKRFSVTAGTSTGYPASSSAMRATLRLSSPAWLTQPRTTSSIAAGSIPGLRLRSAARGMAARSSGRTLDRLPA